MGSEVYDFKSCDKLGLIGESVAELYYKDLPNVNDVINVRNDIGYRKKDIDLVCDTDKGSVYVEVKTDSYATGNMFYEEISNVDTNEKGCMERTEANYLFYYFINPVLRSAYIFDVDELRIWFHIHKNEYKPKRVFNKGYISIGYALPLMTLVAELKNLTVVKLDSISNIELFEEQAKGYWMKHIKA